MISCCLPVVRTALSELILPAGLKLINKGMTIFLMVYFSQMSFWPDRTLCFQVLIMGMCHSVCVHICEVLGSASSLGAVGFLAISGFSDLQTRTDRFPLNSHQ